MNWRKYTYYRNNDKILINKKSGIGRGNLNSSKEIIEDFRRRYNEWNYWKNKTRAIS